MKVSTNSTAPFTEMNASLHSDNSSKFIYVQRRSIVLMVGTLVMAGVVACDLAMQTKMLSKKFEADPIMVDSVGSDEKDFAEDLTCTPSIVNVSSNEYHSSHRYYSLLKEVNPLTAPVFREQHTILCNESHRNDLKYDYCLPISGRKDSPFCSGADRVDLLTQHSAPTRCYASVLHMLLVEVYEELEAFGKNPIVVFGSLLGAVRNGSMIPFTEDTDIAYSGKLDRGEFGSALTDKGYHFFFFDIWRVCVAPTHPLAARLYDPSLPITTPFTVPYLDLYAMEKRDDSTWSLEEFDDNTLPNEKVQPFSQVTINGLIFNTVADPDYFLTEMYGGGYMTPKPRTRAEDS